VSFVRPIVDEFVLGREVPYREAYDPYLYTIVPPMVVKRSVEDPALREDVLAAYRDGRAHNPLDYDADCLQHKVYAKLYTENQVRKFKKYLWDTGGKQADV
jgi:D-aspartate ligase